MARYTQAARSRRPAEVPGMECGGCERRATHRSHGVAGRLKPRQQRPEVRLRGLVCVRPGLRRAMREAARPRPQNRRLCAMVRRLGVREGGLRAVV